MLKFRLFASGIILSSAQAHAVPTVTEVDLGRYAGKWYEVASIPAWFQKKCVKNTTAEYQSRASGKIDVTNRCAQEDGAQDVANGIAHVVNATTKSELKVSFVPVLKYFGWFAGQYKIVALGARYEYSLVGTDNLKFGWILSRTPALPRATLVDLEQKITSVGYDSCQFLMSVQDEGAVTTRVPLCKYVQETPASP